MAKMLRHHAQTFIAGSLPDPLAAGNPLDVATKLTTKSGQNPQNVDASGARDLCLGMAVGVSAAQLVTFAASFRESSPKADLVLFFEAPASAQFKEIIDK